MLKNTSFALSLVVVAAVFVTGVYFYSARYAVMCALGIDCPTTPPATITVYCAGNNCAPQTVAAAPDTLLRGCFRSLSDCRAGLAAEQSMCKNDADCVPATCCHPAACININYKAVCNELCTQICSGPLDCGAGSCQCVDNRCVVAPATALPPGSI